MSSRATPYVGPPVAMTPDEIKARRNRLAEVIPQLEADVDMLARKRGKDSADEMRQKIKSLKDLMAGYDALLSRSN